MKLLPILGLIAICLIPDVTHGADPANLVALKITQPPALDGRADDTAWKNVKPVELIAKGVMPKTRDTSSAVTIRAAYTDTHLYMLVEWTDATKSDAGHKTFAWDAAKNAYVENKDREDMLSLGFEHTGPFTGNMLSPDEAVWDIWHWKAFRTNPQGLAMDRTHRYFKQPPPIKANKHFAKDGSDLWIARPEDDGETVEKKQAAPTSQQGNLVPQYLPGKPTGSAADVQAKGAWADCKWTLEFARKLNTGNPDDTAFDAARAYKMSVSVHNDTGDMDKATPVLDLSFGSN